MTGIELIIDEREDPQAAFRYYNALHSLSISQDKKEIVGLLLENQGRYYKMLQDCDDEKTMRWLQGASQLIDDIIEKITVAGDKIQELRSRV